MSNWLGSVRSHWKICIPWDLSTVLSTATARRPTSRQARDNLAEPAKISITSISSMDLFTNLSPTPSLVGSVFNLSLSIATLSSYSSAFRENEVGPSGPSVKPASKTVPSAIFSTCSSAEVLRLLLATFPKGFDRLCETASWIVPDSQLLPPTRHVTTLWLARPHFMHICMPFLHLPWLTASLQPDFMLKAQQIALPCSSVCLYSLSSAGQLALAFWDCLLLLFFGFLGDILGAALFPGPSWSKCTEELDAGVRPTGSGKRCMVILGSVFNWCIAASIAPSARFFPETWKSSAIIKNSSLSALTNWSMRTRL